MKLALLLALTLQDAPYRPTGPAIEVTMAGGGRFTITTDPRSSPKTVARILELTRQGFYDRQRVHRVEYWVTQWGAPQSKDQPLDAKDPGSGRPVTNPAVAGGGSGKQLPFEESPIDFKRGVVGVASTGLQVGGDSQLFVIKQDRLYLYRSYAVVGKVTHGMAVVDGIKRGDRIKSMRVLPQRRVAQPASRARPPAHR
ncbi:MAG TPA: peptidylprolyl isomerase [Fimbriimonadaceae bacterium]|nr:peptidylprolyl isomerase [Fimbriimonadaceae bacterium]